jgi:hypothetical protein
MDDVSENALALNRTISEVKSPNQIHEALTKLSKLPSTYSTEWEWEC